MSGHELSKFQLQEIQRINKEIQDYHKYLEKIHGKRVQTESVDISKLTKKMRARLEKQNSHITRFSQKKIDELEGQKNLILKQREFSKDIDWGAIRFDDHRIRIVIDGYLSEPFELPESRKSLEFLKMYIKRSRLVPIRARIFGNRVVSIENLDELKKIIEILSIQDEVNLYLNDFQSTSIDKILSKLKKVSNQHLVDLFRLKDRGPYINFLCEIQSHEYKIIPTSEVLAVNDKTSITEETFLFTTIHKKKVFIIWESTLINRATYVFGSNNNSYSADIQRLFDFIASSQSKKRKRLRYAIKTGENSLRNIGVINHDGLNQWIKDLKNLLISAIPVCVVSILLDM